VPRGKSSTGHHQTWAAHGKKGEEPVMKKGSTAPWSKKKKQRNIFTGKEESSLHRIEGTLRPIRRTGLNLFKKVVTSGTPED